MIRLRTNADGSDDHVARSKENIFKSTEVRIEEGATQRDAFNALWGAKNIDHSFSIACPAHSFDCAVHWSDAIDNAMPGIRPLQGSQWRAWWKPNAMVRALMVPRSVNTPYARPTNMLRHRAHVCPVSAVHPDDTHAKPYIPTFNYNSTRRMGSPAAYLANAASGQGPVGHGIGDG